MKLVPTTEKVSIQWFAVLSDGSKMRNNAGFVHNAWDVICSCGWESKTGGAIKSSLKETVEAHKWLEHNYAWQSSDENPVIKTALQDCGTCKKFENITMNATPTRLGFCSWCWSLIKVNA
jgi:hypothetical protein